MHFDYIYWKKIISTGNWCMIYFPVACIYVIVYLASISEPLWGVVSGKSCGKGAILASGPQVRFYTNIGSQFPLLDIHLTPFALRWVCGSVAGRWVQVHRGVTDYSSEDTGALWMSTLSSKIVLRHMSPLDAHLIQQDCQESFGCPLNPTKLSLCSPCSGSIWVL